MQSERLEPFRQALFDLRRRLREGDLEPGDRVTAKDVAERLKLSATPAREALSRLAGEGVLEERRGDGFFVPELTAADISILYRLAEQLLLMSLECAVPPQRPAAVIELVPDDDPVRAVERLFLIWASEGGNGVLLDGFRKKALRLSPVRRREPLVLDGIGAEAEGLFALADASARTRRATAVSLFFARRATLAGPLAALLQRPAADLS